MFFHYRLYRTRKAYQALEPLERVDLISPDVRRLAIHHSGSVERINQLFRYLLDQNPNLAITVLTRDDEMNQAIRASDTYRQYQKLHAIQLYPYKELGPNETFSVSLVVLGAGEQESSFDPVLRELFLTQRFSGTKNRYVLTNEGYFFDSQYAERLKRGRAHRLLSSIGPSILAALKSNWKPGQYPDFRLDEKTQQVVYDSGTKPFQLPPE